LWSVRFSLHVVGTASSGLPRTSTISSGLLQALLVGSSMGSRLLLLAMAPPPPPGHRVRCRPYSIVGGASGRAATSRRAAPKRKQRRPCPSSGGDQHAALDELGDEAEHVALYRAVPYVPATRNPRRRRHGEVGGAQAGILHASDRSRQCRRSREKTPRWCVHGPLNVSANEPQSIAMSCSLSLPTTNAGSTGHVRRDAAATPRPRDARPDMSSRISIRPACTYVALT